MKNLSIILLFLGLLYGCVQDTQNNQKLCLLICKKDTVKGIPSRFEYYNCGDRKDTGRIYCYTNGKLTDSLRFEPRKHENHYIGIYITVLKEDSNQLIVDYENSVSRIDSSVLNGKDSVIIEGHLYLEFKQNQGRFELVGAYPPGSKHTKISPPIPMSGLVITQSLIKEYRARACKK
jgi:hypothetical protein